MVAARWFFTLFIACLVSHATDCHAKRQGQAMLDSLVQELPRLKDDTAKIKLLHFISFGYWNINPDKGVAYGQQELELANKLQWKKGAANAYTDMGTNYKYKSENDKSVECYNKALHINEELGDKRGVAVVYGNLGQIYINRGEYVKGLDCFLRSKEVLESLGDKKSVASLNGSIGSFYFYNGDYPKAMEYYFSALKLDEETGDKTGVVIYAGNVALVYSNIKDYVKAIEFYNKAMDVAKEVGDKNGEARIAEQMGNVYRRKGDHSKALDYCVRALRMNIDIGNRQGEAACNGSISDVYREMKDYTAALAYALEAVKINTEIDDKHQLVETLLGLGDIYMAIAENDHEQKKSAQTEELKEGKVHEVVIPAGKEARVRIAIGYYRRGLDTAVSIHLPMMIQEAFGGLARAYELTGDHSKALEYFKKYSEMKDSLFSEENEKKMIRANLQFDFDKKHHADSLAHVQSARITTLKLQRQKAYITAGVVCIVLLVILLSVILRNSKRLAVEKERSENLLLNIIPSEVAEELKQKGHSAARQYDNITVLFTDFVNFTKAGEKMKPQELIDELDVCFKAFDDITARYKIEKIKTIGDAYLAAAGLPTSDTDHAEHAVSAAIAIRDFMDQRYARLGDKTFEVRIGIHSGSVVAGIVGVKKFAYDIWGDTVNTAARMEQNSEAGKINVSQTTYDLVKDKFTCVYRGEIEAKNKGRLNMYYVN